MYFGGNVDATSINSYYWVDAGDDHHYGSIWIGPPDNIYLGVNEQGLAFGANGLPRNNIDQQTASDINNAPIQILRECATVEEV